MAVGNYRWSRLRITTRTDLYTFNWKVHRMQQVILTLLVFN